jgi:hypothetical protein
VFEIRNAEAVAVRNVRGHNRNVRFIKETRLVPLASRYGIDVSGRVEVRGIDALAGARGFITERHTPTTIVLRDAAGEREYDLGEPKRGPGRAAYAIAPIAALLLMRYMRRKGR